MSRKSPDFLLSPRVWFVLGVTIVLSVHARWGEAQWDLEVYRHAAERVWAGENPYDPDIPPGWEGLTFLTVYAYPPLFVRVLSPFSLLPEEVFRFLWLLVQAAAFESLYFLGLKMFGKPFHPLSWALFHFVGVHHDPAVADFRAGNTACLEAAALAGWAVLHLDRPLASGFITGVLFAVKPLAVFVLIWELVQGRWKSLAAAVLVTGCLGLAMVVDWSLFRQYLDFLGSRTLQEINEEHTAGIYNHATVSVVYRLFTSETVFAPIYEAPLLARILTPAIPVLLWLVVFNAWRRLDGWADSILRNALGFSLLLPTVLLTIPRVGDYNLIGLLIPIFFGGWTAYRRRNHVALQLFLVGWVVGNLPITGGNLSSFTLEMHWLHFRYVSLVLVWLGAWVLTFPRPQAFERR